MHAGKISSCALSTTALKVHILIEAPPCPHPSTKLRETSSVLRNHCLLSNLAWQYPFHISVDDTAAILVYLASYQDVTRKVERLGHAFISPKKEKRKFSKPTSAPEPSHGTSRTPAARKPEAPATETSQFSVLGEKAPSPPSNPPEVRGKSIRGREPEDPTYSVETTGASLLPGHQDVITSSPNPEKEEGEVTSSDAD